MSYDPAFPDAWKRVGIQVSKILGGMKAAKLLDISGSRGAFEEVLNHLA